MRRKHLLFLLPLFGLTLSGCDLLDKITGGDQEEEKQKEDEKPEEKKDETKYDVDLNSKAFVTEKEEGILHEVKYNEYVIDLLGYSSNEGKLGSLKKATYNGVTYNGMAYNRSLIGNLEKIRVDFSGGDLQYVFTEFLMEDMNFDSKTGNKFESGKPVDVPEGKCYFVIYTKSTTPVKIDSLKLKLKDQDFDAKKVFEVNSETVLGGARSASKKYTITDSFIEMENNPLDYNNNYSQGKTHGHTNNDSWYRWNGQYLSNSIALGSEFSFGMTIGGEFGRMVDSSKLFHYGVWPQFGYRDSENQLISTNNNYVQTYIGNDNYEPRGYENPVHPDDDYVFESYSGRFFTNYGLPEDDQYFYIWDWTANEDIQEAGVPKQFETEVEAIEYRTTNLGGNSSRYEIYQNWQFLNPDTEHIVDGSKTFREAYQAFTLPFWFVRFDVHLDSDSNPICDVSINGFKLFTQDIFEGKYDKANNPGLEIKTLPMHIVNYGNEDGTAQDSYTGIFTLPRLIG